MPKRFHRMSRRSVVGAVVGLAFAAIAGVGLAQVTTGSSVNPFAAETTTPSQALAGKKGKPAKNKHKKQTTTTTTLPTTTTTLPTTTTAPTTTASTTTTTATGAAGAGQEKVDVCHKAGEHNQHTINIAAPAVPAHMAHGDKMGPCPMTTTQLTTTQATTTTTAPTTTTTSAKQKKPKKQPKAQKQAPKQQKAAKPHKPKKQHTSSHGKKGGGGKKK